MVWTADRSLKSGSSRRPFCSAPGLRPPMHSRSVGLKLNWGRRLQYKSWKGGEVVRKDIQVGDDTRPFFSISIWQKHLASMVVAGDVVLLQNVKITKFGDIVEGRATHCSSLLSLIHQPFQSLISKGVGDLVAECRVIGLTAKEKLTKLMEWLLRSASASTFSDFQPYRHALPNTHFSKNWKLEEKRKSKDYFSLTEVLRLTGSCKAVFYASVGDIFLPFISGLLGDESDKEKMFVSRRVYGIEDSPLATDLICTGCLLCGTPFDMENRYNMVEQNAGPFYCSKTSNRLHKISSIYRPFMLYVWDESDYVPLLVKNKAAELLFGNLSAERVYSCFRGQQNDQNPDPIDDHKDNHHNSRGPNQIQAVGVSEPVVSCALDAKKSLGFKANVNDINFYLIWLILLKSLLQQGKNSPLKFEIIVNPGLDCENGRFEMVSVWMPCSRTNKIVS
nr:uncharacterized protein LOC107406804 isoform X2 [Ziziphus jujuba var. spinosa]